MLDPKLVREKPELLRESFRKRGTEFDVERLLRADERRRELIRRVEALKSEKNATSDAIGKLKKSGLDATERIEHLRSVGKEIENLDQELKEAEREWEGLTLIIPNIPHASVPVGTGEEQNEVVRLWGEKPSFTFEPLPHWDLGEKLDILDFKRAAKITGSRFVLYKSWGALLERADVYRQNKGISRAEIQRGLDCGKDVVMRLDVQGAETVKQLVPDALLIFITADSEEDLIQRLKERSTETPDKLAVRIATARQELKRVEAFDYVIVNHDDRLDHTVDVVRAIIEAEHHRVRQRRVSL